MAVAARTSVSARTARFGLLGDESLMRLAAAGHERAFAVLYERHHQALYRYCRSILRNDADAQDALQSTFTATFAALERGGPDAPIRPWLFRIAHNEAVSVLRRRRPTVELSDATEFWTSSVDDQVAERSRLDLLLRDLRELHDRQRSALVMRELSGLSHEEIALALETSLGAAKQAIYEARRSLFEFVEGRAMPCDEIRRTISDADGRLLRSRRVRAHLRECSACAEFAAAIPARRRELRALVPPLPAATAAGLLGRAAGAGSAHGTGSGLAGLAVGGAAKTGGAALAANALAGVAVVASATVGVTIGVNQLAHGSSQARAGGHGAPATRSVSAPRRTPALAVSPSVAAPRSPRAVQHLGAVSAPVPPRPSAGARAARPGPARGRPPSAAGPAGGSASTATQAPARATGSSSSASSSPGHSSAAPGHSPTTSTSPGHSAAAPGHSSSASSSPGHSGAAPGHTSSASSSPGHSGAAPGHTPTTSTSPDHSAAAPGHSDSSPSSPANSAAPGQASKTGVATTLPSAVPPGPLPDDPPAGVHGAGNPSPPGHLK